MNHVSRDYEAEVVVVFVCAYACLWIHQHFFCFYYGLNSFYFIGWYKLATKNVKMTPIK